MATSMTQMLEGLPSAILEELKKSAERSQLRQLRRLQQLQKQAEYAQQRDLAWRQKEEQSRERERRKQLEREEETRDRALRRAEAEARRAQNQDQAEKKQLEGLMRLQRKLEGAKRRSEIMADQRKQLWMLERTLSNKRQEKRDIVKKQNEHLREEKRNAMFSKQEQIDKKLVERHQLLERERRTQNYEKHLAEIQRQKEVLSKAARCEEERRRRFITKQEQKERTLQHVQQEKEEATRIKAEKSRVYQQNVKTKLAHKRERDAISLEKQNAAFEEKISRAVRIEKQRDMVRDALSSVRRAMMRQEEDFRRQLEQLKFISFDDYDLGHASTLLSTLSVLSRPKTARGRLETTDPRRSPSVLSTVSDGLPQQELDSDDIHTRAQQLTNAIDQELMKEMEEGVDHLTLFSADSDAE